MTSLPSLISLSHKWEPRKPAPPVTSVRVFLIAASSFTVLQYAVDSAYAVLNADLLTFLERSRIVGDRYFPDADVLHASYLRGDLRLEAETILLYIHRLNYLF